MLSSAPAGRSGLERTRYSILWLSGTSFVIGQELTTHASAMSAKARPQRATMPSTVLPQIVPEFAASRTHLGPV